MSEKIRLYHGTSFDIIGGKVLEGKQPLIGKRLLYDPGWSGTLTDEKNYAISWANRRGPDPIVLTYELPEEILIDEGIIGMKLTAHGFVTTLEVPVNELPTSYTQALLYINYITPEMLERIVKKGQMSFHAVPFKYLINREDA